MTIREYRISPTTGLNLYKECPKCFWLHYNRRLRRPRGIFPSLPGGMDEVIKKYYDLYRGKKIGLPPELKDKVEGQLLPDQVLMDEWRNWRTGLSWQTTVKVGNKTAKVILFGALDECLVVDPTVKKQSWVYIPLDYKTRGSQPREGDSELYYQTQLDSYATLLKNNGYPIADFAYLVYYYPQEVKAKGRVEFNVKPVMLKTDTARLTKLLQQSVKLLLGPVPKEHGRCELSDWHQLVSEFD